MQLIALRGGVEASIRPREVEHNGVQVKSEFGESILQGAQQVGPLGHVGVEAPVHVVELLLVTNMIL